MNLQQFRNIVINASECFGVNCVDKAWKLFVPYSVSYILLRKPKMFVHFSIPIAL